MFPTAYFAPSYFAASYFAGAAPAVVPGSGYRDRDGLAAIVAALATTRAFAAVTLGAPIDRARVGVDRSPLAAVLPDSWSESDDADQSGVLRVVAFQVVLSVRDADPSRGFDRLDRLSSLVQNALGGSDLGGGCVPALTRVRRGRFDVKPTGPESRVTLSGQFAYLIPSPSGHDATP